jgi:radical SAM peptide maturase (CXXX-repeat target family)
MINLEHPWLYLCRFSLCSNGLLYKTPKVQNFFKKYGRMISFTISIDGNKELHDACRIDLEGNGTYDRAIEAVHLYRKKFNMNSTKMTVAPDNVNYIYDAIVNLINENYTEIMLNCVFEKGWNYDHARILYNQLKLIADYLINNNLYNKIYIRMLDENFYSPMDENDNQNWCGGVGDMNLAINYSGNLYPCLRYMESSLNNK